MQHSKAAFAAFSTFEDCHLFLIFSPVKVASLSTHKEEQHENRNQKWIKSNVHRRITYYGQCVYPSNCRPNRCQKRDGTTT
jgi:hypothetical protein